MGEGGLSSGGGGAGGRGEFAIGACQGGRKRHWAPLPPGSPFRKLEGEGDPVSTRSGCLPHLPPSPRCTHTHTNSKENGSGERGRGGINISPLLPAQGAKGRRGAALEAVKRPAGRAVVSSRRVLPLPSPSLSPAGVGRDAEERLWSGPGASGLCSTQSQPRPAASVYSTRPHAQTRLARQLLPPLSSHLIMPSHNYAPSQRFAPAASKFPAEQS